MKNRSVFGWLELAIGILLIGLGIYSFFEPMDILMGLVFLYGLAALATGIGDIVFYCRMDRHLGFGPTLSLVSGILSVMAGFVLAIHPSAGSWAVVLLFPPVVHCPLHLPFGPAAFGPLYCRTRVLCFFFDRQHSGAAAGVCHAVFSAAFPDLVKHYHGRISASAGY